MALATVVMAHLKAQETRNDSAERQTWKLWLTRRLYKLGYDRQQVIDLFRFIDWLGLVAVKPSGCNQPDAASSPY